MIMTFTTNAKNEILSFYAIVVFHEGGLVQGRNYEALMEQIEGKFYELWLEQAQYYQEG